jgi:hypothetical protein
MFENGTGCEWHPYIQTLQCPVVTIRCYPWSVGSWEVFHIVGLCVFSTSCYPPFRQPPTCYMACVYGWQHRPHRARAVSAYLQSEAVRSVHCPTMNPDLNSIEHNYLGNVRPLHTGSGTTCAKHSSVGSNIASEMAAAITTGHLASNWRDETQGWCRHPSTWGLHWVLNFGDTPQTITGPPP